MDIMYHDISCKSYRQMFSSIFFVCGIQLKPCQVFHHVHRIHIWITPCPVQRKFFLFRIRINDFEIQFMFLCIFCRIRIFRRLNYNIRTIIERVLLNRHAAFRKEYFFKFNTIFKGFSRNMLYAQSAYSYKIITITK